PDNRVRPVQIRRRAFRYDPVAPDHIEGVKTVEMTGHRGLIVRVFGLENHDVDAFPAEQGAGPLGAGRDFDDAAAVAQVNAAFNGAGAGELDDVQPVAQIGRAHV